MFSTSDPLYFEHVANYPKNNDDLMDNDSENDD